MSSSQMGEKPFPTKYIRNITIKLYIDYERRCGVRYITTKKKILTNVKYRDINIKIS